MLGVLTSDDFQKILASSEDRRLNSKVNFLRELPVFKGWTRGAVARASYSLALKSTKRGQFLYKEGETPQAVYVIIEGEFKILKSVVRTCSPIRLNGLYGPRIKSAENLKKIAKPSHQRVQKTLEVAIKTNRELLGDIEVIDHKDFDASCMCSSLTGQVYEIDRAVSDMQNFLRLMHQKQSMTYLKQKATEHSVRQRLRIDTLLSFVDAEVKNKEKNFSKFNAIKERSRSQARPEKGSVMLSDASLVYMPKNDDSLLQRPIEAINERYELLLGLSPKVPAITSLTPKETTSQVRSRPLTPCLKRSVRSSIRRLKTSDKQGL